MGSGVVPAREVKRVGGAAAESAPVDGAPRPRLVGGGLADQSERLRPGGQPGYAEQAERLRPGANAKGAPSLVGSGRTVAAELARAKDALHGRQFRSLMGMRRSAIARLMKDLEREPLPEGVGMAMLVQLAESALSVASAGVGGMIGSVVAGLGGKLAPAIAKYLEQLADDGLSTGMKAAAAELGGATGPSQGDFLELQHRALGSVEETLSKGLAASAARLSASPDGVAEAKALADGFEATMDASYDLQYAASAAAWSRLVQQANPGNLGAGGHGDGAAAGVLAVEVRYSDAGADMAVVGARLEGVPPVVGERLATCKHGTLGTLMGGEAVGQGMTVRIVQKGDAGAFLGGANGQVVRIAMESRPGRRDAVCPPLTGHEGRWMLARGRERYGMAIADDDFAMVPIVAQIVWAREVVPMPLARLSGVGA